MYITTITVVVLHYLLSVILNESGSPVREILRLTKSPFVRLRVMRDVGMGHYTGPFLSRGFCIQPFRSLP